MVELAALQCAPATGTGAATRGGLDPPVQTRPPGPLAVLGVRDGMLWVMGSLGQPFALPLGSHAGFEAMARVAAGDLHGTQHTACGCCGSCINCQFDGMLVVSA